MKNSLLLTILLAGCILVCLLAGCATVNNRSKDSLEINIKIATSDDINASIREQPSKVVLRLYQIKDDADVKSTQCFAVQQNSQATLGDNLLKVKEITINTSKTKKFKLLINHAARYLVVIIDYHDNDDITWLTVHPIHSEDESKKLLIHLDSIDVKIN